MWKTIKRCSMVVSIALNVAFVGIWIAYAAASIPSPWQTGKSITQQQKIWCPLHRELDVTEQQWEQIEPRLIEFQAAVAKLRQKFQSIRPEVIDLIAAEDCSLEAIRAKQDEIMATKSQIQGLMVNHLIAEKQILTPNQQEQLFKMLRQQVACRVGPPMSRERIESNTEGPGTVQVLDDHHNISDAGGPE